MNNEISLLMLWMDICVSQQSNLKLLMRKTYNITMIHQPNWLELVLHGETFQQPKTNIVKEAPYLELSMLEGHQAQNMTSCIPTHSTSLSITYECMRNIF